MKWRIKIQGTLLVGVVVLTVLLSGLLIPHWKGEWLEEGFDYFGIFLLMLGSVLRISARGYKAEHSDCGEQLITDGPYALSRNPMYSGSLLLGSGLIAVLLTWWTFPVFLLFFVAIYLVQIKKEEALLLKMFPEEYSRYCKTTPRFFPRPQGLLKRLRELPFKSAWVKRELASLSSLFAFVILFEVYQDARLFGYHEILEEALEVFVFTVGTGALFYWLGSKRSKA